MIYLKNEKEIEIMREGGKRLRAVVSDLLPKIKVGMTTEQIDNEAERLVEIQGGEPSFKKVKGYKWTTCLPINEQVVHTPPSESKVLTDGDILTLDIGMYYKGFHTDYATTFLMGSRKNEKVERFLKKGERALSLALEEVMSGKRIGHISKRIEDEIKSGGYFILKQLTGHGIGRRLHEEPYVLGFLDRPIEKTLEIRQGLVLAVEVIYSMGTEEIAHETGSNWSMVSADRSLTACFEHTVAVGFARSIVLT